MEAMEAILRGIIHDDTFHRIRETVPIGRIAVFVSSTFTDSWRERNALHSEVLPKIQAIAMADDIQIILFDMRFGVKDQNTFDHMTWEICRDGIQQCRESSDGLFFLSLQGDRYGYRPLPKYISQASMEIARNRTGVSESILKLSETWYRLDENHIPPRYELKNLMDQIDSKEYFDNVLPLLRDQMFNSVAFEGEEGSLLIGRSVTEWESVQGLLIGSNINGDTVGQCAWVQRQGFDRLTLKTMEKSDREKLCDVLDSPSEEKKLELLKAKLVSALEPQGCVVVPSVSICPKMYAFSDSCCANEVDEAEKACESYLSSWMDVTSKLLMKEVDEAKRKKTQWVHYVENDLGLPTSDLEEMLHHCRTAYDKVSQFIGREDLVTKGLQLLRIDDGVSATTDRPNPLAGITLAIIGKSGSGKTALMSKLMTKLSNQQIDDVTCRIPILIRFCGTSHLSLHGLDLIQSLSLQILLIYKEKDEIKCFLSIRKSQKYEEAVSYFHALVAKYPMYLFIDSLDQLSNRNEALSKLSFLKSIKPAEKSRIVISTLPDEQDSESGEWKYRYCEHCLKACEVSVLTVDALDTKNRAVLQNLIGELLKRRSRCLSPEQWAVVLESVAEEPTMLYVSIAIEVICKWESYKSDLSMLLLRPSVVGLIEQLFVSLERQYGERLVSTAFALITFSVEGVSDIEMQDLLTLHGEVMEEVNSYFSSDILPMHVWLRLKFVVQHLIAEKEGRCVKWYHRQIWETAARQYSSLKQKTHLMLGMYFHKKPLTLNEVPSVFHPSSRVNGRKMVEAPFHLVEAGLWNEAVDEMCTLESVCAASLHGQLFTNVVCLSRMQMGVLSSSLDQNRITLLDHYLRFVRLQASKMIDNPRLMVWSFATEEPSCSLVYRDVSQMREASDNGVVIYLPLNRSFTGKSQFSPMLADLHGHSGTTTSVAWNRDGNLIASGSGDKTVKIWDAVTGEVLVKLQGHSGEVKVVAWNHDGSKIASGSADKTIKIWDTLIGEMLMIFEGHSAAVMSVSWNFDDSKLVSGSADKCIKIWNASTGQVLASLEGHSDKVWSLSWSHDGRILASGSWDKTIRIWDAVTCEVLACLEGHSSAVNSVSWNHDSSKLASGSYNKTIKVWNSSTWEVVASFEGHTGEVTSVLWNHDSSMIASGSWDKTIKIWDAVTGKMLQSLQGHCVGVVSVAWNHDGSKIASGSGDKTIKVWEGGTKDKLMSLEGHFGYLSSVVWNGSKIVSGSGDKTIKIWDELTGTVLVNLEGHSGGVNSVACSQDGSKIASGAYDKTIKIWDVVTGKVISSLTRHSGVVDSVAWNHDDSQLASGSYDKTIKIWDAVTWEVVQTLEGHSGYVIEVTWNHDSSKIASGSWDKSIKIWSPFTGTIVASLEGHLGYVCSVSWSHDSSKIASGSYDKTVKVWDAVTGEVLANLEGHSDKVNAVAWNRDGSKLASGSDDKTIKVWDYLGGILLASFVGHSDRVWSLSWNHDSSKIASGSGDMMIKLWNV